MTGIRSTTISTPGFSHTCVLSPITQTKPMRLPDPFAVAVDAEYGNVICVTTSTAPKAASSRGTSAACTSRRPQRLCTSFTQAALLGRPVLRLSAVDAKVSGPTDDLLAAANGGRSSSMASRGSAAAEEVAEPVRLPSSTSRAWCQRAAHPGVCNKVSEQHAWEALANDEWNQGGYKNTADVGIGQPSVP